MGQQASSKPSRNGAHAPTVTQPTRTSDETLSVSNGSATPLYVGIPPANTGKVVDRNSIKQKLETEQRVAADAVELAEQELKNARFTHKYLAPLFNISDALKPQPPIDWRIEGFAETGGVMGFFGAPGSKKTYSVMDMGLAVALGQPWLGRATKQCGVLWIDEDSGRRRLLRRLGDVARGHKAHDATPFEVLSLAGVNILKDEDAEELERLITVREAGLVVLDTLADVCGGAKIVSPDEMLPVLQSLRRIAEATGALIVFIHHTNKGGEFLGAITIAGKADLLLQIESKPDSPLITFTTEKARDSGALKFAAKANFYTDTNEFWLEEANVETLDKAKKLASMGGAGRHVYDHLKEHGQATIEDMTDELNSKGAVSKAVGRLTEDGFIKRINDGGRGSEGIYALADN